MDEEIKIGKVSSGTVSRIIILLISIFNELAVTFNWYTINITNDQVTQWVSLTFFIVMALWCAWKNNSFTPAAMAGDVVMQAEKAGKDVDVVISDKEENEQD